MATPPAPLAHGNHTTASKRPRPAVEPLEARRLLSAAALAHGVLRVVGDARADNAIDVEVNAQGQITVSVQSPGGKGATSLSKVFAGSVTRIDISGGRGNDTITAGTTSALTVPTRVFGIAGTDSISVGDQNARLFGGRGTDTFKAGNGNNLVVGGPGADSITVGNGNDTIFGGDGADVIVAGAGSDKVHAGKGDDTVTVADTAPNSTTVFAGPGKDSVTVGDGNDTVWGGAGDDIIHAGNGNDTFGAILGANTVFAGSGHNTYVVGPKSKGNNFPDFSASKDTLVTKVKGTNFELTDPTKAPSA